MVRNRGTVLMETVLVLPILTLLIFAIVQFALIWYAQIMTQYAAYNAARATSVYHPGEYRISDEKKRVTEKFMVRSGPCWDAACRTLAWVSSSPAWDKARLGEGSSSEFAIPGWYAAIPNSSYIEQQVRIVYTNSVEMTNAPVVRVTVEFDYPLHVPVIGHMLAYFDKVEDDFPSSYEVWGWRPDAAGEIEAKSRVHKTMGIDYISLQATAILPKPWHTSHFARKPQSSSFVVQEELKVLQLSGVPSGLARANQ